MAGLSIDAPDARAIQGVVLADLAFDVAARAALDERGRTPNDDKFPALLAALPELGAHTGAMRDLHVVRNRAQHGGIAPPAAVRQQLRLDAESGLGIVFELAGADYKRFSSVPQIRSAHFSDDLAEALALAPTAPADAMALVMRAFRRLRGWAEQIIGAATIPDLMWVHYSERWNDARWMAKCADNRDEFVDGMLRIAAATVLHITVPDWIRLNLKGSGHEIRYEERRRQFVHEPNEDNDVTIDDVAWAVEVVARAVLALELEWPHFRLVPVPPPEAAEE
jgi:hypothetical protein